MLINTYVDQSKRIEVTFIQL